MYTASDLRKGLKVEIDGQPWEITEFDFCKPGKGQALYRCRLRNLITGYGMEKTWRPADRIDKPNLESRELTYVYQDGDNYVFSDDETYEEMHVSPDVLGVRTNFLIENMKCEVLLFNEQPIDIELPIFITKEIVDTEPAVRGDTATNVTKPAKIDNGYEIAVPLFINVGDIVKIDTRTGQYSERISKG